MYREPRTGVREEFSLISIYEEQNLERDDEEMFHDIYDYDYYVAMIKSERI